MLTTSSLVYKQGQEQGQVPIKSLSQERGAKAFFKVPARLGIITTPLIFLNFFSQKSISLTANSVYTQHRASFSPSAPL